MCSYTRTRAIRSDRRRGNRASVRSAPSSPLTWLANQAPANLSEPRTRAGFWAPRCGICPTEVRAWMRILGKSHTSLGSRVRVRTAIGKVITFTDTEKFPKAIQFAPKLGWYRGSGLEKGFMPTCWVILCTFIFQHRDRNFA